MLSASLRVARRLALRRAFLPSHARRHAQRRAALASDARRYRGREQRGGSPVECYTTDPFQPRKRRPRLDREFTGMELIFLGTGAGGPSASRSAAALALRLNATGRDACHTWLFDCGEGTTRQLMASRVSHADIDKIFATRRAATSLRQDALHGLRGGSRRRRGGRDVDIPRVSRSRRRSTAANGQGKAPWMVWAHGLRGADRGDAAGGATWIFRGAAKRTKIDGL